MSERDAPAVEASPVSGSALADRILTLRDEYLAAGPWPNIVLDDALPESLALELARALPGELSGPLVRTRGRLLIKNETSEVGGVAAKALAYLESPEMVAALRALTGIADLRSDPRHRFGGIHETPTGGYTLIHHDFERHPDTRGLHHRLNMLLYATEGWQESWGGQLELWPVDMAACGRRVVPAFNRLVIFETSAQTPHGLPNPVAATNGITRMSLASYWYAERPSAVKTRLNAYHLRPTDGLNVKAAVGVQIMKSAMPVKRTVRNLTAKLRSSR